jgi:hypothetical protein
VILSYDGLCLAQCSKPPLDLKVLISSNAFYNSAFFYEQLEFARFVFVLIVNVFQSSREVDSPRRFPDRPAPTRVRVRESLLKNFPEFRQTGR